MTLHEHTITTALSRFTRPSGVLAYALTCESSPNPDENYPCHFAAEPGKHDEMKSF
jgi:hypothetical protein